MAYDNICRYLAVEYPDAFVNWLLDGDITAIQPLPTELNLEPIRSDALYLLPDCNQILHLEFQTVPTSKPTLPLRMLDYWVRLYRKYNCSIEQVVIFLKETTSEAVYINQFAVDKTFHSYRVVRIWEQDPSLLLTNPGLLPLAVLAQTDSSAGLLEQVAAKVDMIKESDKQRNISACVEVLARLKFEEDLVRQFLREELMRESPLYQEILQEGVQQGIQLGIQQGIQQGEVTLALRLLTRRLGTVSPELQAQIQQLSSVQLEALSEALLDFSTTEDLIAWLQVHQ
ncbi:DUF4351 domain-containing protein [Komarekiella sp. 'clone 1']|uniref:DUF4351 domain-containing protein n=1 Tax=Komarekiella delphini-convector SJRDD-AB1 TaxID=2593771 RepID=A0AA40VTN0_9NOST|nr:DUF4351 domain-containing protein [Komarekiella delphini-convector]MBD6619362.1 DUF4351 domain-containing protein [Komarekiella delphini-convector SJRDD-AB1]